MKIGCFFTASTSLRTTAFASLLLGSLSASAGQPVINLSVSGEIAPGTYGQVQIGNAPPPPVVYAQPVVIAPQPVATVVEPIYLHVPPGHARDWAKHCHKYNACNRPVYFVKSAEYEPGYRARRERREERRLDEGRRDEGRRDEGHGHGHRDEGRRGDDRRD